MTWELLLLEVAVGVSQSLSSVSWVLATIHSFTIFTLGHVKIASYLYSILSQSSSEWMVTSTSCSTEVSMYCA